MHSCFRPSDSGHSGAALSGQWTLREPNEHCLAGLMRRADHAAQEAARGASSIATVGMMASPRFPTASKRAAWRPLIVQRKRTHERDRHPGSLCGITFRQLTRLSRAEDWVATVPLRSAASSIVSGARTLVPALSGAATGRAAASRPLTLPSKARKRCLHRLDERATNGPSILSLHAEA